MSGIFIVHVIDDDEAVRESLAFLLLSAGHAARTYASADQFLGKLDEAGCGCIVTDIRMPGLSGLELIARLKERGTSLPIIAITGHADVPMAVQAMKAGIADFIEKPFNEDTILHAVDFALRRGSEVSDNQKALKAIRERATALTARERQVLDRLVDGQSNKAIAREFGISPRTVEAHRANVMTKMDADSLSQLVRMAMALSGSPFADPPPER
ncbi:response regulator FixJ [Methylobacterium sp. NPDC080182]|uniref:response regulator FixJ n=1 Tax=Methylobacterium sp. NPDC080182 TaxID=3390590 RepID=UPI003D078D02